MGETTRTTKPTRKTKSTRIAPFPQTAPVDELETFIEAVPYGVAVYDTGGARRALRTRCTVIRWPLYSEASCCDVA